MSLSTLCRKAKESVDVADMVLIFDSRRVQPMIQCSNCKSDPCINGNILNEGNVLIGMKVKSCMGKKAKRATVEGEGEFGVKWSKRRIRVRWANGMISCFMNEFMFLTHSRKPRFIIACPLDQEIKNQVAKVKPPKSSSGKKSSKSSSIMNPATVSSVGVNSDSIFM